MGMQDVIITAGYHAAGKICAGTRQRSEALPVIRPVAPIGPHIGPAAALEQGGRIEHQEGMAVQVGFQNAGRHADERVITVDMDRVRQMLAQCRIARDQRGNGDAMGRQRARQGGHDIGQPTCLDQWINFRRDRENLDHAGISLCSFQAVDHFLGNQADAVFRATEAAGVQRAILADHQAGRDRDAAVQHHP